jgi:hypothetical protein
MGIEPMLVVWDKRKEWPLPGSCRCILEGPLVADHAPTRGHTKPMHGESQTVIHQHREHDIRFDPFTARTRWRGESMDYGLAIDVLLTKERKVAHQQLHADQATPLASAPPCRLTL